MALTKCPECKKRVSDTCTQCIHCGYMLSNDDACNVVIELEEDKTCRKLKRYSFKIIIPLVVLVLAVVAICVDIS